MLDTDTRRRIDTARDILVGKVPDPKSQVEQITIALIYKFMDDMDAESEELGGRRSFFDGGFARYGWARLMRAGLGGHEILNLYAEAITRMPENPGIPLLFRDIFKNAYLPYRDPETLRSFLKVIDEFAYDHSERLGDAFEYLLSILGSQGDAGQFRTPRHVIDFIVAVIDPKKDETVLDPACGTAGFLISAYKHILRANMDMRDGQDENHTDDPVHPVYPSEFQASMLTPDERGRLAENFKGYDISPDMVRLSLVNMYLHGLNDPRIFEYDTLTSEDRWNEYADVILANPPFMSPKGGIRPHNRFSVQSRRSEVLFVDYMAEHLTPSGRAGIIVPEGIIFQSQNAYKQLRRMLVEEYLVAVVSLPAGVFNPYAGVKTSVLLLDKSLAKRTDRIAFFKVENDGFDLGAQRREIDRNDLPDAAQGVKEYMNMDAQDIQDKKESRSSCPSMLGSLIERGAALIVEKEKIAADGDYNLSGERYRENGIRTSQFPIVPLGKVAEVISGQSPPGKSYNDAGVGMPFYQGKIEFGQMFIGEPTKWTTDPQRFAEDGDILMSVRAPVGPVNLTTERICIGRGLSAIRPETNQLLTTYAFYILRSLEGEITGNTGAAFASINKDDIKKLEISLPPPEVQKEIVAEIEGYQKVIDGARAVIDNYRSHIPIDPAWPMVPIGDLAQNLDSRRVPIAKASRKEGPFPYYGASGIVDYVDDYIFDDDLLLISEDGANLIARSTPIAFSVSGKCWVNNHAHVLKFKGLEIQKLVEVYVNSVSVEDFVTGSAQPKLNQKALNDIPVPTPHDIDTQRQIVSDLEAEQALVNANRDLVERMERKIAATIGRVWGEKSGRETQTHPGLANVDGR